MAQTLNEREDPLNLGGNWASSVPLRTWSCNRRRGGTPIYKRRHYYGPKTEYEPPRKQPEQQHGPGPWFQPPPRRPYWAVYSNCGPWRGHWRPPATGFRKYPGRVQEIRIYGLYPFCLCCCSCWRGPLHPGWARPYGRKKRWGHRGRGLRRHPRRSFQRSPPVVQPDNLHEWRPPGLRAPRNTTQFIMNQIYEDMREQEKLQRQQEALRAQQAQASCAASPATSFRDDAPPSGGEEDAELQKTPYNFVQNPLLVFSPASRKENPSPTPQLVEEEEEEKNDDEECDEAVCEGEEEESDGEDEEVEAEEDEEEAEDEEEVAEAGSMEEGEEEEEEEEIQEEEEGVAEEDEQSEEENRLPLEMPLSILTGAEEDRGSFVNGT